MTIQIGVVMDPIESIYFHKDSTLAMLWEAQRRRWQIQYMQPQDLFIRDGKAYGQTHALTVTADEKRWFSYDKPVIQELSALNVILMRKDPPFNMEYIYSTYLLELAEKQGALVVNKPSSLRDANEKLFASWFPQCCPPTLVSRNKDLIQAFIEEHQTIVLKPLAGMGGASILLLRQSDPNINAAIELISQNGSNYVMAQRYIPEIRTHGDKRIILINGEPIPYALARIPAADDFRGNLAAGAKGVGVELTARDLWLCEQVAPTLRAKGLLFVGLDVIGDYITEINVTSPTGIRQLDEQFKLNISAKLFDCIENHLKPA